MLEKNHPTNLQSEIDVLDTGRLNHKIKRTARQNPPPPSLHAHAVSNAVTTKSSTRGNCWGMTGLSWDYSRSSKTRDWVEEVAAAVKAGRMWKGGNGGWSHSREKALNPHTFGKVSMPGRSSVYDKYFLYEESFDKQEQWGALEKGVCMWKILLPGGCCSRKELSYKFFQIQDICKTIISTHTLAFYFQIHFQKHLGWEAVIKEVPALCSLRKTLTAIVNSFPLSTVVFTKHERSGFPTITHHRHVYANL